uniref:Neurotransmitter-gated ion-channel transmembrane domain-containing protein n=1 Tax=Romanomermis culicivorax TaxID=13658 RepID=A0A915K7F2_ROMCU
SHTINYIRYEWRDTSAILISPEFKNNVANFQFEQVKREKCLIDTATTGTYSCLKLALYFKRTFSFSHFVNLYLPGFLLVVISWLSFWLSVQAISTRITFALFCFLTLIIQFVIVSPTFPPSQTYRSIDLWFVICLLFLSLALIQCIIVYRITELERKPQYYEQQAQFYGVGGLPQSNLAPIQGAMVVLPSQNSFLQTSAYTSYKKEDELSRVPSKLNAAKASQHKRSWAGLNPPKKSTFVKPERRISTQQDMN